VRQRGTGDVAATFERAEHGHADGERLSRAEQWDVLQQAKRVHRRLLGSIIVRNEEKALAACCELKQFESRAELLTIPKFRIELGTVLSELDAIGGYSSGAGSRRFVYRHARKTALKIRSLSVAGDYAEVFREHGQLAAFLSDAAAGDHIIPKVAQRILELSEHQVHRTIWEIIFATLPGLRHVIDEVSRRAIVAPPR
jgi:hypothetical protein